MTEAGEVKLTAKDFVTQAKLTVNGMFKKIKKINSPLLL